MKLAWKKMCEQHNFITFQYFVTSCVHSFRVVQRFKCKQKEMGYVVEDSLWCPSTAFTPMPCWVLHINWLFITRWQHIFGPVSSFLLFSWPEYSCFHVQSFSKNNRFYSPPNINYNINCLESQQMHQISSVNLEGAFCLPHKCCMH